jgi:hypothetical protein
VNVQCGDFFLKDEILYCILLKRVFSSHFLAMKYDHMVGAGDVVFILVSDDRWN